MGKKRILEILTYSLVQMQLAVVASASNTFFNWSIWRWRLVVMPSDDWLPFISGEEVSHNAMQETSKCKCNNRYVGNVIVTTTSILLKLWQVLVVVLIAFAGDLGGFILVAAVKFQEGTLDLGGSQDSSW